MTATRGCSYVIPLLHTAAADRDGASDVACRRLGRDVARNARSAPPSLPQAVMPFARCVGVRGVGPSGSGRFVHRIVAGPPALGARPQHTEHCPSGALLCEAGLMAGSGCGEACPGQTGLGEMLPPTRQPVCGSLARGKRSPMLAFRPRNAPVRERSRMRAWRATSDSRAHAHAVAAHATESEPTPSPKHPCFSSCKPVRAELGTCPVALASCRPSTGTVRHRHCPCRLLSAPFPKCLPMSLRRRLYSRPLAA